MDKKNQKTVTRRDFLKGFGSGALGAAVAPKLLAQDAASLQTSEGDIPVFSRKTLSLAVNDRLFSVIVEPRDTLLDVLRNHLNLTGSKKICDRGECGGCTVLLDGKPVYACMTLAIRVDGQSIQTVEGLAAGGTLHPVQQAFIDKDGYQCGFCTPGFLMASAALLKDHPKPTLGDIKRGLSGNICRCGNYTKIFEAVAQASNTAGRP